MVQHVLHFMDPATLMFGAGENLIQSLPEPHGTVANRNFRRSGQAAALDIHQQLAPALGTFSQTNLKSPTAPFSLLALPR